MYKALRIVPVIVISTFGLAFIFIAAVKTYVLGKKELFKHRVRRLDHTERTDVLATVSSSMCT